MIRRSVSLNWRFEMGDSLAWLSGKVSLACLQCAIDNYRIQCNFGTLAVEIEMLDIEREDEV